MVINKKIEKKILSRGRFDRRIIFQNIADFSTVQYAVSELIDGKDKCMLVIVSQT